MTDEVAREGNRALAQFMNCSLKTACRYAKKMRLVGVVFKWRKSYVGKNGKRRYTTVNRWYASRVQSYLAAVQRKKDEAT